METIFKITLILHIAAGTLSLLAGPVAMATHKGGTVHRIAGKLFFSGMSAVFVTAVLMSLYHNIPFLLMVGVFSYQLVISGYRSLFYKKLSSGQKVKRLDWMILALALLFNAALIGWGLNEVLGAKNYFGIVAIVFGIVGLSFVARDWRKFAKKDTIKINWLYDHISGMMGGYIAAVTAFLVVNFTSLPFYITWLGPTIVGIPVVSMFITYYRRKLNDRRKAPELITERIDL